MKGLKLYAAIKTNCFHYQYGNKDKQRLLVMSHMKNNKNDTAY